MENLNAEQIIENLERSIRLSMDFNSEYPVITYSKLRDALALIKSQEQRMKELAAENERLRADNEIKSQKRANIFEITNAFERGRTDGVRKMQEMLKEYFPYDADSGLYVVLDQIAKEMLEGTNGNQEE